MTEYHFFVWFEGEELSAPSVPFGYVCFYEMPVVGSVIHIEAPYNHILLNKASEEPKIERKDWIVLSVSELQMEITAKEKP